MVRARTGIEERVRIVISERVISFRFRIGASDFHSQVVSCKGAKAAHEKKLNLCNRGMVKEKFLKATE